MRESPWIFNAKISQNSKITLKEYGEVGFRGTLGEKGIESQRSQVRTSPKLVKIFVCIWPVFPIFPEIIALFSEYSKMSKV